MGKTQSGRVLNWKRPALPHHSVDILAAKGFSLPPKVDLRDKDTPIFNQGPVGSCTMNAGCALYDYLEPTPLPLKVITSRRFGYHEELDIDGNQGMDVGSSLHTCSQVFLDRGVCSDSAWPYDVTDMFTKPSDAAYADAANRKIKQRLSINQDLQALKECLAQGFPFIYGMSVYESFENAPGGVIPYPGWFEQNLGGHALMIIGYDDASQYMVGRNSWGTGWGDSGYFYIPYKYITNHRLADDFWTFRL